MQKICQNCGFFEQSSFYWGECHRNSPRLSDQILIAIHEETKDWGRWPYTDNSDWCGEFRPREKHNGVKNEE